MAACAASKFAQQAAMAGPQVSTMALRATLKRRPAMARTCTKPNDHLLVGVDISKHRHEVLIAVPGKQRRRRMSITNTAADFERLAAILSGYDLPVRVGF